MHYNLRSSTFADQLAACNQAGHCFVTNDVGVPFAATISLRLLNVASGVSANVRNISVDLPAGAGVVEWFCAAGDNSGTSSAMYSYYPCQTPVVNSEIKVVTSATTMTLAECQSVCDNSSTCTGFLKHVPTDYYPFAKEPAGCSWFHQTNSASNFSVFRLENSEPTDWWQKPSVAAFPGPSAPATCAVPKQKACTTWSSMSKWRAIGCDKAGTNCVVELVVTNRETASVASTNVQPFVPPKSMQLPLPNVTVEVGAQSVLTNEVELTVRATGTALYVVLTTLAEGRFSENAFLLENQKQLSFVSWSPLSDDIVALLKSSVRVEHLAEHVD